MNEKAVRTSECDELETLNLLQVDMQKRTEELKQLWLDLFPAVSEVSNENGNDDEHVTICGVPEDSAESGRWHNGGQGLKNEDTLAETGHVTNTIGEMVEPDHHRLISSSERESERKSIPWTDLTATKTKEGVSLSPQSWSIPKLLNGQQGYQDSVIPTYSDSSSLIHQDFVSSAAAQLGKEAATGRVLLDSLANENKLEEKLTLSELEVKSLKTKISQMEEHRVKEVNKHKDTIQVLLQRVDQVSKQKQEEVSNREKEAKAHEDLIFKLTGIVQNAEKAMGMLEKKLEDAKQDLNRERILSGCRQEVLRQICESLKLAETDDSGDGTRECAAPQLICKLVKRYVDRRENQVTELLQAQKEAEERCSKLQKEVDEITVKLNAEYKERFTQLIEDQNKQLEAANERAFNARQQTQGLQTQLQTMEQHSKLEIEAKSRQNSELSERIKEKEKKVEKLISEQQTEVTRCREELTKTHQLLDAKDRQITDMEKNVHFVEEKLEKTKLNLENAIRELNESQKERSKVDQLQLDTENKLSICQKILHEKSEELIEVKKTTKLEEDKYKKEHQDEISGLKKEMEMKFMDEKRTNEENGRKLNEELEKSEDNLRKKKCELKKTKELNKQQQCRIRELESNLEILNHEKSESVSQQEKAGRDLLVLQHERNLLENLYEKTKKEAQVELKDKSRMENVLKEMEPRYRELLIENQKLSSELEKTGERLTQIESDRSQLMLEVKDRDERLEEISKIRSEVDRESEAKDKKLRELEGKLKEAEELSKEQELITENLKTGTEKLQETLQEANDKILQLTNERTSLVEVSSKQKTNLEKDKRILSSQIKILQNELRLVKGRKNIVNSAVNEQVDIAVQQGLVESMQGEITWLEERLSSTQEILRKEEEKVKGYEETQRKAQSKIERLEKERKEMIRRKKVQKTLVLKLESALEKTSVMFRESQQQSEKQAQELARLRLQYQLELKELKGNLVNQLTNTFILPKLGKNSKLQVGIPEISDKAAVGGDQLRTKPVTDCEMDQSQIVTVMNQVMKEMEKKQRDGENCNNSLQPLEVNYNNSETKSSSTGQKKQHHIGAECMSQQHGERIIKGDKSQCFSSPDSSLSKPGSASSAKSDSPVSILLSRGCLPQEMTKNTADLSNRTHLNANKRTNTCLDRKELHVSTGHQQCDSKMKGFVDKLDKLTLMGNQLIDENMEMEMLLVEQEEQR